MNTRSEKYWLIILGYALLAITFAAATYIIFFQYKYGLNSDGAQKALIARLAMRDGTPIPKNWIYANGDLWITGPQLFSIILFPLFGLNINLILTSDWISLVFILIMVFGTCKTIQPNNNFSPLIATTLCAGCLSALNFEFVVGQAFYAIYPALGLALFASVCTPQRGLVQVRGRATTTALVTIAAALVCVTNPTRGGITIIVPLVLGWFAWSRFASGRVKSIASDIKASRVIIPVIAGAFVGTLAYKFWLWPGIVNTTSAASSGIAPLGVMLHHLSALPEAWFKYFDIGGSWHTLNTALKVVQGAVWILAVAILVAPIWTIATPSRRDSRVVEFSWMVVANFVVVFGALVASDSLFVSYTVFRYATLAIYASVCIIAIEVTEWAVNSKPWIGFSPLLLSVLGVMTITAWSPLAWGIPSYKAHVNLINSLKRHDVGTILATYWNANVLTVLSRGTVESYPSKIVPGSQLAKFDQNEPTEITRGSAGRLQAIALTQQEAPPSTWRAIEGEFGHPEQVYDSGPFIVWTYDRDIAQLLYGVGYEVNSRVPARVLRVSLSRSTFPACRASGGCTISISATNVGTHPLSSAGLKPIRLGIKGVDAEGHTLNDDLGRIDFPLPLLAGASERIHAVLPTTVDPKVVGYRICLLQELVAWHCNLTVTAKSHVDTGADGRAQVKADSGHLAGERFGATLRLDSIALRASDPRSVVVGVSITNTGDAEFGSATPPEGVNLGAHAIGPSGNIVDNDLARGHLPQVDPGATVSAVISLPIKNELGLRAELLPVAEGVGWFNKWGTKPLIVGPFEQCVALGKPWICDAAGHPLPPVESTSGPENDAGRL